MTHRLFICSFGLLVLSASSAVAIQNPHMMPSAPRYDYSISVQAGSAIAMSKLNQSSSDRDNTLLIFKKPLKSSVIYNFSVAARAYDKIFLALELSHAPKHKFSSAIEPIEGIRELLSTNVSITSLFLNSLYHVEALKCGFTPYIGLGIGFSVNRVSRTYERVLTYSTEGVDDETRKRSDKFAWQVILGASFPVNERVNLDFSYRYQDLGRVTTGNKNDPDHGYRPTLEGNLKTSNVLIGITYKF